MKKAFLFFLILVILVFSGAVIWILTLDLDPYIPRIESYAKEKLGQEISIGGINFSFTPGLSIKVEDFLWQSSYDEHLSLQLKEFFLHVRLLPLLVGSIDVSSVVLDEPLVSMIRLARKEKGIEPPPSVSKPVTANSLITNKGVKKGKKLSAHRVKKPPVFFLHSFNLHSARIRNGKFIYQDDTALQSRRIFLENINLGANFSEEKQQFLIKGSAHLESFPIEIKGFIGPLKAAGSKKFHSFKDSPFRLELSADNLTLQLIQTFFPHWAQKLEETEIEGPETFSLVLEGTPALVRMNFFQVATEQSIWIDDLFSKEDGVIAETRLSGRYEDGNRFLLEKFQLVLEPMTLKGSGEILFSESLLNGFEVEAPTFSLSDLKDLFPGLEDWNLEGDLQGHARFEKFNWLTHKGHLTGELNVECLSVKPPNFRIPIQSPQVEIGWDENNIFLKPTVLNWDKGLVRLEGKVADYWSNFKFSSEGNIEALDLEKVLAPFGEKNISLTGKASGRFFFEGENPEPNFWQKTLKGHFDLLIEDGSIRNFNFVRNLNLLEEFTNQVSRLPLLAAIMPKSLDKILLRHVASPDTDFDKAQVVGEAHEGIIYFSKIALVSPQLSVLGSGKYEIEKQNFNFEGRLIFSAQDTSDLIGDASEFKTFQDEDGRVSFPFIISGQGNRMKVKVMREFIWKTFQNLILKQGATLLSGGSKQSGPPQKETVAAETTTKTNSLDELLNYGLEKILKKKAKHDETVLKSEGSDSDQTKGKDAA